VLQLSAVVLIVFHLFTAYRAMNELTDWLGDIHYNGMFAGTVVAALRLVYWRGIFDGFIAGAVVVLILKRDGRDPK
jgi:hypothetical protein